MSLRTFAPANVPLVDAISSDAQLTLPRFGQIDTNSISGTPASGAVHLTLFRAAGAARQTVKFLTGSVAAAAGTLARLGLYSYDGTTFRLLSAAPAETAFAGTFTAQTGVLASPVELVDGDIYAIGNLQVATTVASMIGSWFNGAFIGSAPPVALTYAGQADLPASIPQAGCATHWVPIYYEVS